MYLRRTPKPRSLTVKKPVSIIHNINTLLLHVIENASILTKKELIDEVFIPNIPFQYFRKFCIHYDKAASLRNLARKITDIIPENEEHVNRRDKRREHNGNDKSDDWDRKQTTRTSDSKNTLKNKYGLHKGHELADYRHHPANSDERVNERERGWYGKRQEHRHNRRRNPSKSPSSQDSSPSLVPHAKITIESTQVHTSPLHLEELTSPSR